MHILTKNRKNGIDSYSYIFSSMGTSAQEFYFMCKIVLIVPESVRHVRTHGGSESILHQFVLEPYFLIHAPMTQAICSC